MFQARLESWAGNEQVCAWGKWSRLSWNKKVCQEEHESQSSQCYLIWGWKDWVILMACKTTFFKCYWCFLNGWAEQLKPDCYVVPLPKQSTWEGFLVPKFCMFSLHAAGAYVLILQSSCERFKMLWLGARECTQMCDSGWPIACTYVQSKPYGTLLTNNCCCQCQASTKSVCCR